jgi:CHAT domain-containing protein
MEHTGFPSEETLAAFIDGRLDDETRRRVVEHMAICTECYETFLGATEWGREGNESRFRSVRDSRPTWRRWSITAAVAAAAIVAIWFAAFNPRLLSHDTSAALIAATNDLPYRPIDCRLNGDFRYKELEPVTRGKPREEPSLEILELQSVANSVARRARLDPSSENQIWNGIAALLAENYKDSQMALEGVLRQQGGRNEIQEALGSCRDVNLLNGLAALYVARSSTHPAEALLAVEAAERAWSISRTPETAWNRAVALEAIHAGKASERAWLDYLRLDGGSAWSVEAMGRLRKHRTNLGEWLNQKQTFDAAASIGDRATLAAIASRYPQEVRVHAEDELLRSWAVNYNSGSGRASSDLQALAVVGRILGECNGDNLTADLVARIVAGDERSRSVVARGIEAYSKACSLHVKQDAVRAVEAFKEASAAFHIAEFPLWLRADVLEATALDYAGRSDEAVDLLASVEKDLTATHRADAYPSVLGQELWISGFISFSRGRPIEALHDYERATLIFEKLGEAENAAFLHTLSGQVREFIGQESEAWHDYITAAGIIEERPALRRTPLMLGHVARNALVHHYVAVSNVFQEAALQSGATDDSSFRIDALLTQARSAAGAGDLVTARSAIRNAAAGARTIADEKVRRRIENDVAAAAAEQGLLNSIDGDEALTNAIGTAERDGDLLRTSHLYFARAAGRAKFLHNDALAIDDFNTGIAVLEKHAANLSGGEDIREWLRAKRDLFDQAIEFAMSTGRPALALAWSERAHSRSTARSMTIGYVEAARAMLRPGDVVITYWSTEKNLYIWCLSHDGLLSNRAGVSQDSLRALSGRIVKPLSEGRDDVARTALAEGYDVLLAPVSPSIARATRALFVPDDALAGVPYSALFDRSTNEYVLQRFQVVIAPSLEAAIRFAAKSESAVFSRALVIADPAFDSEVLPALKRVRRASEDVAAVRRSFRSIDVLADGEATAQRVVAAMTRAPLIHFAGHSISNAEQPALSALVLASDTSVHDSGLLYARRIEELDLHNVRLVVLASCASASGAAESDGFAAVADSFANAGVENILGTLWDIRDGSSTDFMSHFYEFLVRNQDPAESIREAQLAMMQKSSSLTWAAFELVSGS